MACECITETKKMKTFFHCRRGRIFSGGGGVCFKIGFVWVFWFFFLVVVWVSSPFFCWVLK